MICRHNRKPKKTKNITICASDARPAATPQDALEARLAGTREKCRVGDRIRTRDHPWNEVLRPAKSSSKPEK